MQHHSEHPYERLTPDCVIDAVEAAGYPCDARLLALNSYDTLNANICTSHPERVLYMYNASAKDQSCSSPSDRSKN